MDLLVLQISACIGVLWVRLPPLADHKSQYALIDTRLLLAFSSKTCQTLTSKLLSRQTLRDAMRTEAFHGTVEPWRIQVGKKDYAFDLLHVDPRRIPMLEGTSSLLKLGRDPVCTSILLRDFSEIHARSLPVACGLAHNLHSLLHISGFQSPILG